MAEGSSSTAHTQRTIMVQQYFAALVKRFLFNDRGTVLIKFPIRSSRSLVHPETFFVQNEIGIENEEWPEISLRSQERHISGSNLNQVPNFITNQHAFLRLAPTLVKGLAKIGKPFS